MSSVQDSFQLFSFYINYAQEVLNYYTKRIDILNLVLLLRVEEKTRSIVIRGFCSSFAPLYITLWSLDRLLSIIVYLILLISLIFAASSNFNSSGPSPVLIKREEPPLNLCQYQTGESVDISH